MQQEQFDLELIELLLKAGASVDAMDTQNGFVVHVKFKRFGWPFLASPENVNENPQFQLD